MADCKCRVLNNGVPDVLGFGLDASSCVVVKNISANVLEICDNGHKVEPNAFMLCDPSLPLVVSNRKAKRLLAVAEFTAKGQISKRK